MWNHLLNLKENIVQRIFINEDFCDMKMFVRIANHFHQQKWINRIPV